MAISASCRTGSSFTASITPDTATPFIHYVWIPLPESGQGTDTVVYKWSDSGGKTIVVTAKNANSSATDKYNVTIFGTSLNYYFPIIEK